jgi:hypothetical protein
MESLASLLGITPEALLTILVVGGVLLVVLFVLRMAFKMTARLLRLGCLLIILVVGAIFAFSWLGL